MNPPTGGGFAASGAVTQASSVPNPAVNFGFSGITAQSTPKLNLASSTQLPTFGGFTAGTTAAAPATTTAPVLSFLSATTTPASVSNIVSTAAPTTAATGLTFGTGTTAAATGLTFGTGTTATSNAKTIKNVSFSLSNPAITTSASPATKSILKTSAPVSASSTVTVPTTSAVTSATGDQAVNYVQLQDLTNKWISDFEDLQKLLLNQTAEIINRDVILASNEDKIEKLVNSVQNLKTEQTVVEQQLDFILSQQKDLEECLVSLEDEVSSYFPELPADDMYKLAENIDSRLKKTLETSKEIITKINDKNRLSENVANPMVAIGRILNHLTNSIQMLENMNAEGQTKLNDLQKMYQQYAM